MIKNAIQHDQGMFPKSIQNKDEKFVITVSLILSSDFVKNLRWQQGVQEQVALGINSKFLFKFNRIQAN